MIQLATPISHLFESVENAEKIIAVSDCLECRERSLNSTYPEQNLFHFDIDIIHNWNDELKSKIQHAILSKKELKLASFQIAVNCDAPILKDRMYQLGGYQYKPEEMILNARDNLQWLRSLNKDLIFAIENNNYYPTPAYEIVTEGAFISQIVNENAIYFLFDIAHAQVSAHNLKCSYEDYKNSLPLDKIIQIHICRPNLEDTIAYDAHEWPDDMMFEHVIELIKSYPVRYLTIEYYKNPQILVESLKTLRQRIAECAI